VADHLPEAREMITDTAKWVRCEALMMMSMICRDTDRSFLKITVSYFHELLHIVMRPPGRLISPATESCEEVRRSASREVQSDCCKGDVCPFHVGRSAEHRVSHCRPSVHPPDFCPRGSRLG